MRQDSCFKLGQTLRLTAIFQLYHISKAHCDCCYGHHHLIRDIPCKAASLSAITSDHVPAPTRQLLAEPFAVVVSDAIAMPL